MSLKIQALEYLILLVYSFHRVEHMVEHFVVVGVVLAAAVK